MGLPDTTNESRPFVSHGSSAIPVHALNALRSVPSLALTLGFWPAWAAQALVALARYKLLISLLWFFLNSCEI